MKTVIHLPFIIALGVVLTACNQNYKIDTSAPDNSGLSTGTPGNPQNPQTPTIPTCTVGSVNKGLRILFMIDDSGSTLTTDPNMENRVDVIQAFLNKYASKTNLTYSYNYFGTNAATYNIVTDKFGNTTTSANVFGTAADATDALNVFKALPGDAGNTYYSAAFTRIESIIQGDLAVHNDQNYVVIFMSDGQPTDPGLGSSATAQINLITQVSADVMGLAASGRITVSTVYFGPTNAQAQNNLFTMATLGKGQFIDTNLTTQYSVDNLISVPITACN